MRNPSNNQWPSNYYDWLPVLNEFAQGTKDPQTAEKIRNGKIQLDAGGSANILKKLIDAVNSRLNLAADGFHKQMNRARGDEGNITRALIQLRKELSYTYLVIASCQLDKTYKDKLLKMIQECADDFQNGLSDSARHDRTGKLGVIVRRTPVNSLKGNGR